MTVLSSLAQSQRLFSYIFMLDVPPHDDWSIDDDSLEAPTDDSLEAPTSSQEQKRVRLDVPPHDGWNVGDDSLEVPYYRLECEVRPSRA